MVEASGVVAGGYRANCTWETTEVLTTAISPPPAGVGEPGWSDRRRITVEPAGLAPNGAVETIYSNV